jgi:hypothetical protein
MVDSGNLPESRSRIKTPPKILSFQRAYMRRLISSVKAFASAGENFLPISKVKALFSVMTMLLTVWANPAFGVAVRGPNRRLKKKLKLVTAQAG